jgi:hypothetical protein
MSGGRVLISTESSQWKSWVSSHRKSTVHELILQYLPSFAWQTGTEVFWMLEPLDGTLDRKLVAIVLKQMADHNEIDVCRKNLAYHGTRGTRLQYHYRAFG